MTDALPQSAALQSAGTEPRTQAPAVRVRGLRKTFGQVDALKGIDFDLAAGEFVTLLGPSGCGKTTTLRLIAGLEQATGGSIELFGKTVVATDQGVMRAPKTRPISMVFQSYALWPHLSALKNVMFPLENRGVAGGTRAQGVGATERRDRAMEALRLVKCDHLAERYPGEMSGGQQQRIALARALVVEPPLLLLDEPLSNLDAALRRELRFELRALQETLKFTAIYVTHDQVEALSMSDRIILMNNGSIEQQAAPDELFTRPRTRYAAEFIGDQNLVRGRVISDGETVRVRTPIGVVTAVRAGQAPTPEGGDVTVAIRTDRLRVVRDATDSVASVTGVAYCGAYIDIAARTDDGTSVIVREHDAVEVPRRAEPIRFEVTGTGATVDG